MVRRHGWQLPAHTLQVVAITVFFLLVIAFYAFFAPFLGGQILEYTAIAIYTPVVLAVFILYVRCTAINPADPGILQTFDGKHINKSNNNVRLQGFNLSSMHSSPSSAARSSRGSDFQNRTPAEEGRIDIPTDHTSKRSVSCLSTGGIICGLFVQEDCRKHGTSETQADGEGALFCTLCNVEVSKFSKHCRCCDKCVDGFDHHCRWLNNCVGRRNYMTFVSLMMTSLSWLLIECGVGIAVFVRCFTDRKGMEHHIIDKLGNGFSRAPFATIAAVCSAVSLLACVPLWQLFFFHMLLIRKGLTTYEYVVAMRVMSEPPEGSVADDNQNVLYSPAGSATTGLSGRSSLSQQYKAAWCTPPRVFVDDQDEVVPHLDTGMIPSTANPAPSGFTDRGNKLPKRPIKRSAWKLAKLDPNEAMKAAAKARASSSVLRPAGSSQFSQTNASSSSRHSNVSTEFGINNEMKNDMKPSPVVHSCSPSHASSEGYERSMSSSSALSPSHVPGVLGSPVEHPKGPSNTLGTVSLLRSLPPDQSLYSRQSFPSTILNPILQPTSASDNKTMQKKMAGASAAASSGQLPALARESKRISVVWDQEAGRYVSVPPAARTGTALEIPVQPLLQTAASNPPLETSSQSRRAALPEPSTVNAPMQQPEKLMCREQSIFFGGPILDVPARECKK